MLSPRRIGILLIGDTYGRRPDMMDALFKRCSVLFKALSPHSRG